MFKHILVPLENTETDEAIVSYVAKLATSTHAQLLLVHVADGFAARYRNSLNLADSEEIVEDRAYLDKREAELTKQGLKVKTILAYGDPGKEILQIAIRENCDLIAMSTHGHGFFADIVLGSVANEVRHETDVPVLMIRAKKKKAS